MYKIRPSLLISSFDVYCSFNEIEAFTEIPVKDQPNDGFIFPSNESQRCNDPECFSQMIDYSPTNEQIEVPETLYREKRGTKSKKHILLKNLRR